MSGRIIPFPHLPTQEASVRKFHFPAGVARADAIAVIAAALEDEGLRLLATAQGGRIISVREGGFDAYVIPASLIGEA